MAPEVILCSLQQEGAAIDAPVRLARLPRSLLSVGGCNETLSPVIATRATVVTSFGAAGEASFRAPVFGNAYRSLFK